MRHVTCNMEDKSKNQTTCKKFPVHFACRMSQERYRRLRRGFTLLEVIVSIGIVVLVTALGAIFLNPAGQLAKGRNSQRWANVNSLLNAVGQNTADNKGSFNCTTVPTSTTKMASSSGNYNIASCLVSSYLSSLPYDPTASGAKYKSVTDYDTGYTIARNATTGRMTFVAASAELNETISVTR